jgi:hypothetical protein
MIEVETKIAEMLGSGKYNPPTVWDDLPAGIRFATDLAKDPFCPGPLRELLVRWTQDAATTLSGVGTYDGLRAWMPTQASGTFLGIDRSKANAVMLRPMKPDGWWLRVRRWLVRLLGGEIT